MFLASQIYACHARAQHGQTFHVFIAQRQVGWWTTPPCLVLPMRFLFPRFRLFH